MSLVERSLADPESHHAPPANAARWELRGAGLGNLSLARRPVPSPGPGELLLRVTGNEKDKNFSFLSNHPFTEDRLALMKKEDRPPTQPPILSDEEWMALRSICKS